MSEQHLSWLVDWGYIISGVFVVDKMIAAGRGGGLLLHFLGVTFLGWSILDLIFVVEKIIDAGR